MIYTTSRQTETSIRCEFVKIDGTTNETNWISVICIYHLMRACMYTYHVFVVCMYIQCNFFCYLRLGMCLYKHLYMYYVHQKVNTQSSLLYLAPGDVQFDVAVTNNLRQYTGKIREILKINMRFYTEQGSHSNSLMYIVQYQR